MKTERRHELQQNSLVTWIQQSSERLKPYSTVISTIAIAVVALLGISYYVNAQRSTGQLKAWDEYLAAVDEPGYDRLADLGVSYKDSNVGMCALLVAADRQLQSGVDASLRDRTAAAQDLRMALDNYTQVVENADDPLLRERGLIGKAYTEESLAYDSADNLHAANATYEQYLADFPDGIFAKQARIRLADLGNPATASFYDWFATQAVSSPEATDDIPGLGTGTELDTLPEGPGSSDSTSVFEPAFDDDESTTDETAEMEEPTSDEKPATEAPTTEEPSSEEPAAEEPPVKEPEKSDDPTPEP